MTPIMFTFDTLGHRFLIYVGLEDSLMDDAIRDSSLIIFEDDIQILGVFIGRPTDTQVGRYKGEGIRDMLSPETLERFQAEGLIVIEEHLSVERASHQADHSELLSDAARGK